MLENPNIFLMNTGSKTFLISGEFNMMNVEISYDELLYYFENDGKYPIDETTFYFDDDPDKIIHYIGCLRQYEKPYWAGYCDISDGCEFFTAEELFTAKIYNNKSIKDRWKNIVIVEIGGMATADWIKSYLVGEKK